MFSIQKLISAGISIAVLVIVIVNVIVPIITTSSISNITGADTLKAIINLLPLLLGIAGFLTIIRLFTGKN